MCEQFVTPKLYNEFKLESMVIKVTTLGYFKGFYFKV
jgi:hypothetical protein